HCYSRLCYFTFVTHPPPCSLLFPYTTLFRSGPAPLTVNFITGAEYTDGAITRYEWDFDGDGKWDTDDPGPLNYTETFSNPGTYKDRKSTRLNSSHVSISYAVFCLKKKKK